MVQQMFAINTQDRSGLPPSAPEKTDSVERSVQRLMQLIQEARPGWNPMARFVLHIGQLSGGSSPSLYLYVNEIARLLIQSLELGSRWQALASPVLILFRGSSWATG